MKVFRCVGTLKGELIIRWVEKAILLVLVLSCDGTQEGGFAPNNLISLPEDDIANARYHGNPYIKSISIRDEHYSYKEHMYIDVTFTQWLVISEGTPRIPIDVGGTTVYANYISGSGTATLRFKYAPQIGELDGDGVEVISPWELNEAVVKDRIGQTPQLTFSNQHFPGALVDTAPPTADFDHLNPIIYVNKEAYTMSGYCSDIDQIVDIFIGDLTQRTTCQSNG